MSIEIIFAIGVAVVDIALGLLSQVFWWQRKEYRWDRMRAHVTSPEGSWRRNLLIILAFIAAVALWLVGTRSVFTLHFLVWLILLSILAHHLIRIRKQGVLRPDMTLKARLVLLVSLVLILCTSIIAARSIPLLIVLASAVAFLPLGIVISVVAVNIPTALRKRQIIRQATSKRNTLTPTVVGITGSVGKTSTKFFLHQILEQAGKDVHSTKQHRNSEFTVAQDILEQLDADTDIYIAEMGAYRRNEIRLLSRIAKPTIGVITAIGNQHLALFGSQQNLLKAKWELVESLGSSGVAILNADDKLLQQQATRYTGKVIWYSTKKATDVYMRDISFEPTQTRVTMCIGDTSHKVTLPLVSAGLLSSFTAAVATAHALGVDPRVIAQAASLVKPFSRTMEIRAGKNGSTVIDDSYSASEDAVENAVAHLRRFSQPDKRIILVPVIELGAEGSNVHQRLSEVLGHSEARVFVYGHAFQEELALHVAADRIAWFTEAQALATAVTHDLSSDAVLLLEGRIPSLVRKAVIA